MIHDKNIYVFFSPEHSQMKSTVPIYLWQSLQGYLSIVQSFINSLKYLVTLPFNFAIFHIYGTREDMIFVSKYTLQFLRRCRLKLFLSVCRK